jgi:ribonuclease PH
VAPGGFREEGAVKKQAKERKREKKAKEGKEKRKQRQIAAALSCYVRLLHVG